MQRHYPLNPATGLEDAALLPWANGNPALGTEGSYPPFGLFTDPQDEILNAIAGSGQAIGSTLSQLLQALSRGIFLGTFAGTANALTAALPGSVAIPALTAGMRFTGIIASTNTGAVTLTLSGFTSAPGPKAMTRPNISPLKANDVVAGQVVTLVFDGTQFQAQSISQTVPGTSNEELLSSTTRTIPAGVYAVTLDAIGGGGGGGYSNSAGAGGGGSGAGRSFGRFAVTPGEILTITIGAGGASYIAGGTTSVVSNLQGTLLSASGGSIGGIGSSAAGSGASTSGNGTGGQINQPGELGVNGTVASGGLLFGGPGGGARTGGGYTFSPTAGGSAGASGTYPGGGGSGGAGSSAGGPGAQGRVIYSY